MTQPRRIDPARVAALPSLGHLALVGMAAVLLPGIAIFVLAASLGLATGPAGLLGLLAMFVGLGAYPFYLRRLSRRLPPSDTVGE